MPRSVGRGGAGAGCMGNNVSNLTHSKNKYYVHNPYLFCVCIISHSLKKKALK